MILDLISLGSTGIQFAQLESIKDSLNEIEAVQEGVLEQAAGGVSGPKAVADTHTTFTLRPSSNQVVRVHSIRLINNHATLARTAILSWSDGVTNSQAISIGSMAALGGEKTIGQTLHNDADQSFEIRRNKFIRVVFSGVADVNEYDITYAFDKLVGTTDPTFASVA